MKRLFTIFATFAMLCAVGCEEQGGDDVNPNDKPNTEEPSDKPNDGGGNENGNPDEGGNENEQPDENLPEEILFALNKTNITISPDGGSVDVTVYSNYKWEIEGGADWCTPSVTSGEANENGQTITFSAELTYDTRETVFWFTCANE